MALNRKQRAEIINGLTNNCDCWKHEGSKEVLSAMEDDQLVEVAEAAQEGMAATAVANAALQGFTDEKAGVAYRLNPDTGGWERKVLTANVGSDEPTANAPPWLKNEEDEEEDVGQDMAEEEVTEEDTPPVKSKCQMLKEKSMSNNSRRRTTNNSQGKKMSLKRMLEDHGTPEERAVWNHAVSTWEQQKQAMVDRIVANHRDLRDEDVSSRRDSPIYHRLMQRTPDELQEMLDLLPANTVGQMVNSGGANYVGAVGGAVTSNRFGNNDPDDVLVPPRMEWEPLANGKGK